MKNPYSQQAYSGKSREEIVLEYAPLVKHIANRLAARLPEHMDRDDLVQAGMIGLLDAIEKYDPQREAQFRTYAEFRIKGAMLDDLRATDWIPRAVRENADRVANAQNELMARLGRPPDDGEIARELGLSLNDYHQLLFKSRAVPLLSLEDLVRPDEEGEQQNIFDVLEDPAGPDPLDALTLRDLMDRLTQAIGMLPEKEQLVLSLYYNDGLNLKEIGQVLGITESRVSQIRTQAIMRLRGAVGSASSPELLERLLEQRAS